MENYRKLGTLFLLTDLDRSFDWLEGGSLIASYRVFIYVKYMFIEIHSYFI